jgi:very-short-patch-repair endonuclease
MHLVARFAGRCIERSIGVPSMQVSRVGDVEKHRMHTVDAERAVLSLAARQHGAIATWQMASAGLGRSSIAHRVRRGTLEPVFRGVYAVGPLHGAWTRKSAALLACGEHAVLSHHGAAGLWELGPQLGGEVDVTLVAGHRAGQAGIRIHHARFGIGDARVRRGLRVTAPARTLLDLAAILPPKQLERAIDEAQIRRLTTLAEINSLLARSSRHRGAGALKTALRSEPGLTRSGAERLLRELVRRVGLPVPRTNARVGGYEVDALWSGHNLIVEVDSWEFHSTRGAFERDRRKTQDLEALGYRVLRITAWQLLHEPEVVAARLAVALSRAEAALAAPPEAGRSPPRRAA